ncbi:Hypothetical predicted protein [Mytilus galloprovincialis]|uniref:Uncharacterized protein n=1 Tax=Mytilus galloprovincialis TaxID=29158 RepID=A0A8B6DGZ3_MYTGA|nr:Hypothetical predicted protein [Mytilus galloprovincialis]
MEKINIDPNEQDISHGDNNNSYLDLMAAAEIPKIRTEMDYCGDLLGETEDTTSVVKFQTLTEKYPANKNFDRSFETSMAKLQSSVSREHNKLKCRKNGTVNFIKENVDGNKLQCFHQ